MKNIYLLVGLILFGCSNKEIDSAEIDSAEIVSKIVLPKIINETSGLEFYNNNFITHNDSGGEPSLYVFNEMGEVIETIGLNKNPDFEIENNDWEDITNDNEYLFVADTGNNFGNRDNLNIIRVSKGTDFMVDGIIEISYSDQESFFPRPKHKYDAEAIIVIEDKIALFSKDRENLNTDLYLVDKNQNGSQILTSEVSYNVNTLITGGDYDEDRNLLALVSYNSNGNQYLLLFKNFKLNNLENNTFKKFKIPLEQAQIEAVKIIDEKSYSYPTSIQNLIKKIKIINYSNNKNIKKYDKKITDIIIYYLKIFLKEFFISKKQIDFIISENKLMVRTEDAESSTKAKEILDVNYNQENITVGFNANYLSDILNHIETKNFIMRLNSPISATLFSTEDNEKKEEEQVMLLMPMRTGVT